MRVFVPDFQLLFQNITLLSDEEIRSLENNVIVPGLLVQKYYKNKKALQTMMNDIFYFLSLLEESRNLKMNFYVYLTELFDENKTEFMKRIDELEPPVRDKSKNWILQLEQKGIEKGIEKTIKNLISKGYSNDFICDVTEATSEHVEKIRKSVE